MDPISQGVLGASLPQSVSNRKEIRIAGVVGFLSALLADLDILIRSSTDPLLVIDYHRHFTHALAFIPIGGLIAASVLWVFLRKRMGFLRIYIYATLGYATAGLLDACTNYGTRVFWPFSDERVAWNIISIIDPIFTITLLVIVVIAFIRKSTNIARVGVLFAVLYLLLGYAQRERATSVAVDLAGERGHRIERILVHPSLGNLVLWRSVYESDGRLYADAVWVGPFSDPVVYEGDSLELFDPDTDYPGADKDSVLYNDVLRFQKFTGGYLSYHPDYPNIVGDMRYSIIPNGIIPLWGITLDTENESKHIEMLNTRGEVTDEKWNIFFSMLRGQSID